MDPSTPAPQCSHNCRFEALQEACSPSPVSIQQGSCSCAPTRYTLPPTQPTFSSATQLSPPQPTLPPKLYLQLQRAHLLLLTHEQHARQDLLFCQLGEAYNGTSTLDGLNDFGGLIAGQRKPGGVAVQFHCASERLLCSICHATCSTGKPSRAEQPHKLWYKQSAAAAAESIT